ncbi:MAG: serine hydrolase domain-containing protein [Bacteroidota bacterium]
MRRTLMCLTIIINIVLISRSVYGQENKSSYSNLIEDYKTFIKQKMESDKIVGVSAALILGDSITWKEGFGYADKDNKIPMTTQTNISIGSVGKPFTALAIMQLQEKGFIDINKPLIDYLPQFTINTRVIDIKKITLKTIINHSSGIPGDVGLNSYLPEGKYTDVVKYLKDEYLCFPPNMVHLYSNVGYSLLGHAIFTVTVQDYPLYIQKNILEPLTMDHSGFINSKDLKNVSMTYNHDGTYRKLIDGRDLPAGCGLYSNIDDLIKFAKELIAIYNGKQGSIIKTETLKEVFKVQNSEVIFDNNMRGLGWYLFYFKSDSNVVAYHAGSTHLSNAAILIIPGKKMASIFLDNTIGGLPLVEEGCLKLVEACGIKTSTVIRRKYVPYNPNDSSEIFDISVDSLKDDIGIYAQLHSTVQIKKENEKLVLHRNNERFLLKPISKESFIPCKLFNGDSLQILSKQRYFFRDINNYRILFLEEGDKQYQLGYRVDLKDIDGIWKNRLGRYKLYGYQGKGPETFSEAELYVADNNLLQLKIFYTLSGESIFNLHINSDNELIFCGVAPGGGTLRFSKDDQKDIMIYSGLTLKKVN